MKTLIQTILIFILFSTTLLAQTPQQNIDNALGQSFQKQKNLLVNLIGKQPNNYWNAYASFMASIVEMGSKNNDQANVYIQKAITFLEEDEERDSESYALEGSILGFSISVNPSKTMSLANKSTSRYKKAIKLDKENPRAYLGLGENDFHTPVKYGGGKVAEKYLLKAIACENKATEENLLPSWGKERAYSLLVQFYKREGKMDAAKKYCKEGLEAFPYSYELQQISNTVL